MLALSRVPRMILAQCRAVNPTIASTLASPGPGWFALEVKIASQPYRSSLLPRSLPALASSKIGGRYRRQRPATLDRRIRSGSDHVLVTLLP